MEPSASRRGRRLLAGALVATVAALGPSACSSEDATGVDAADRSTTTAPAVAGATLEVLDVEAFAERLAGGPDGQVVVNVHVPYEGEIDGTDLFLPYDTILDAEDLPEDRATPLLLYCRSGRMSAEAGAALVDAGYTDVAHLDGGMVAWEAAGRAIEQRPRQ